MTVHPLNAKANPQLPKGSWRALFVSDIHICHGEDERASLLLEILDESERMGVQGFFLLGDIFDFCLGTHSRFVKKFRPVFEKLEQLKADGKDVVFVEGNHEFFMQYYPTSIAVKGLDSHIHHLEKYGVSVAHGDLFAAPERYLWFRKVIKSDWLRRIIWIVPGWFLDLYAYFHSGSSRKMDHYRKIDKNKVLNSAAEHMQKENPKLDTLVFGHFHYPFDDTRSIDGSKVNLISMYSWDKPSCLLLSENGALQRVELSYE